MLSMNPYLILNMLGVEVMSYFMNVLAHFFFSHCMQDRIASFIVISPYYIHVCILVVTLPINLKVKRALTCKVKFDQNSVQSQPEPGLT